MKRTSDISDSESDSEETLNPKRARISDSNVEEENPLQFGEDGFVEGSIMKIALTNFVTYDYCEIFPGPQMNMIIGPNGTGKSTIVCAIALGLGGSPNLLGRQKNIAEFVKTGEDEANIKITLKKVQGPNVVIERHITKSNNQTTWKLNGRGSTLKDVMKIIHGFNIQVDNLCQFLPQDRVSEFAELTPSQLLEKTQAAAGEVELYEMQQKLIDLRNKEKELTKKHESDNIHVKDLNNRNAELERDVIKMRERDKILNRIHLLKAQIPLAKYTEVKKNYDSLKIKVQEKKDFVTATKNAIAPIQDRVKEYEDIAKDLNERKNRTTNQARKHQEASIRLQNAMKEAKNIIKSNKEDIGRIQRRQADRQKTIETTEANIRRIETFLAGPIETDFSHIEEKIAQVNTEAEEIEVEKASTNEKGMQLARQKRRLTDDIARTKNEIKELENVTKQRMDLLYKDHGDTHRAIKWLKEHQDEFQSRVYLPILMSVNLKDTRYAGMFESALGGIKNSKLRTIVCESIEDYRKVTRTLCDDMKLKIAVACPGELRDLSDRKPVSDEELKNTFGMDGYLIDFVEAPPYLKKYLCAEHDIHEIPVALERANEGRLANSRKFKKFAVGENMYTVKFKNYGSGSRQTSVFHFYPPRYLGSSIDKDKQNQLKEKQQNDSMNVQQIDTEHAELQQKQREYNSRLQELDHSKRDLQGQKREIQQNTQRVNRAELKLKQLQDDLIIEKRGPEEDDAVIERLKEKIEETVASQKGLMNEYTQAIVKYVETYTELNEIKLELIQANAKFDSLRRNFKDQQLALEEAKSFVESAKRQLQLAEREVKLAMTQAKHASQTVPEELIDEFNGIITEWKENGLGKTVHQLEISIEEEIAKSQAIRFANPNAMANFEKRKKEIEQLENKIAEDKADLLTLGMQITEIREQWEPRLCIVVSKINEKFRTVFESLASAGEIQLSTDEDFDKWGIEIWVKFRDNEKLQLLTGHRQSGGERSVSTILYLMALQDLARSPFRVVDEINQGMDPRNERKIHEQIVQGASKPGTSQYFLITPKLLPDLFYNERMKVLCIYNGEWLPNKINPLAEYLANARAAKVV